MIIFNLFLLFYYAAFEVEFAHTAISIQPTTTTIMKSASIGQNNTRISHEKDMLTSKNQQPKKNEHSLAINQSMTNSQRYNVNQTNTQQKKISKGIKWQLIRRRYCGKYNKSNTNKKKYYRVHLLKNLYRKTSPLFRDVQFKSLYTKNNCDQMKSKILSYKRCVMRVLEKYECIRYKNASGTKTGMNAKKVDRKVLNQVDGHKNTTTNKQGDRQMPLNTSNAIQNKVDLSVIRSAQPRQTSVGKNVTLSESHRNYTTVQK